MFDTALELYNKPLNIHKTQYDKFIKAKKKRTKVPNVLENIPIGFYLDEDDLPTMPPLVDDEEIKLLAEETIAERIKLNPQKRKNKGTGLKVLTRNKLVARLSLLLAQIKFGSNLCK